MIEKIIIALIASLPVNIVYSVGKRMNKKGELPDSVLYMAAIFVLVMNIIVAFKVSKL